jgi:ketosteroid isomerase-like protein
MSDSLAVVERLVNATNAHDIDALVDCFAADYVNETPTHPARSFRGSDQVRRNWTSIMAGVPDIRVRVIDSIADGHTAWTEWEMRGTKRDGSPHSMAGVIIFGVVEDRIRWARFYLEPVEQSSGDVDAAVARAVKPQTP